MDLNQLKVKTYKYASEFQETVGRVKTTTIQYVEDIKKSIYGFLLFLSFLYIVNFAFTVYIIRYL